MTKTRSEYRFAALSERHVPEMCRIFNHYVADGYAAYPERPLSEAAISSLLGQASGHPTVAVEGGDGHLMGFGFLRPYSPHEAFSHTAQITIFLDPRHTRAGIGTAVLGRLTVQARRRGIERILAHVSSRNPASLAFHLKHGFVECGRFPGVGRKWGEPFDVVWMIKTTAEPEGASGAESAGRGRSP